MSVAEVAERIRTGALTARAAVEESLRRIENASELNSFISVRPDKALREADELDRGGPRGPLHGIPIAVKDVIDVAGERTTAASRILADNVAARDAATIAAAVVERASWARRRQSTRCARVRRRFPKAG